MSLGRRILNVAKAELGDAARRVKRSAEQLFEPSPAADGPDPEVEAIREQIRREEEAGLGDPRPGLDVPPEVRTWYGNLELPIGADAAEVKAAYRRLMRRYHPDKHALDPAQAKVAHEITQKLRAAYEGLTEHLEGRG